MATEPQRISRLEGAYEQVDARLTDINNRMDTIEASMNSRFNTRNNHERPLQRGERPH